MEVTMRLIHWQDFCSLTVGAWLCVSALVLGLGSGVEAWTTAILGLLVILLAVEGLILPSYFEELGETILAIALIAMPWTIGYPSAVAAYNSTIAGILVVALALSEMFTDREFLDWWRKQRLPTTA
jgi:SPW repeat-containing protein